MRQHLLESVDGKELEKAAGMLGLDSAARSAAALKDVIDSLESDARRTEVLARGTLRRLQTPLSLTLLISAVVLVPAALAWMMGLLAKSQLGQLVTYVNSTVLAVAGALASAAGVVGLARTHVRKAVATLENVRGDLDKAIAAQVQQPSDRVKKAEENLVKLTADVEEARALLVMSSERLAEAAREYESGTGRGRLLRFVRERASNGQYAKHLGLVAAVRRDFADLSAMMSTVDEVVHKEKEKQIEAYEARLATLVAAADRENLFTDEDKRKLVSSEELSQPSPAAVFKRIILYIDDLDRCPPEQVVDVLQAVHLLLTFPLFIVVVAVDARWVSRCLETHYEGLLEPDGEASSAGATARDYLEKIFQVPYWVREMTPQGSQDLLAHLAEPPKVARGEAGENRSPPDTDAKQGGEASIQDRRNTADQASGPTNGEHRLPPQAGAGSDEPVPPQSGGSSSAVRDTLPHSAPPHTDLPEQPPSAVYQALKLTAAEKAFMTVLAPHAGRTPRRALRFLNVFRVVKASLPASELKRLEEEGGYRALMTQLAMVTGSPSLQRRWIGLLEATSDTDALEKFQARLEEEPWLAQSAERDHLRGAIRAFSSDAQVLQNGGSDAGGEAREVVEAVRRNAIPNLKHYSGLAKRYSFGSEQRAPSAAWRPW